MENNGDGPLRVPGFGDVPLDDELPITDRFAHGFSEWAQVPAITHREFAMVAVMNDLTDRPSWHTDIFDQETVDRWRDEVFASAPLLSKAAWQWCVAELRDKAVFFREHGYVCVLDTGSRICKSDTLVSPGLCDSFRSGLEPLLVAAQSEESDGRPDGVFSHINPSSYPLVWGKSLVLSHGGRVTRQGSVTSSLKPTLETAPAHQDKRTGSDTVQQRMDAAHRTAVPQPWYYSFREVDHNDTSDFLWSYTHQWLPSDVEFTQSTGTDVRLTSYVNDLRSAQATVDGLLEKLISLSIRPWNDCLIEGQAGWSDPMIKTPNGWAATRDVRAQRGRVPCRIITYGVEWENEAPEWMPLFSSGLRSRLEKRANLLAEVEAIKQEKPAADADRKTKTKYKIRLKEAQWRADKDRNVVGLEPLPELTPEHWDKAREYLERAEPGSNASATALPENWEQDACNLLSRKVRRILRHKHPEPGTAFSYDEWKSGTHGGRAIVDKVVDRPINPDITPVPTPHEPYAVCLEDQFRSQGLQVIVSAQSIELNPERTEYPGSTWGLAGLKNEHVVAIALFAYDVDNATSSRLSFRQQTEIIPGHFHQGPHRFQGRGEDWSQFKDPAHMLHKGHEIIQVSEIFGFDAERMSGDLNEPAPLPIQDIGRVALPQGRLITFPNTMEHRREPFRLIDPTKPGHHRCVTLMLVDPHYRICSTKNVPRQQPDMTAQEEQGGEGQGGQCFSEKEAEGYRRDMERERAWANYARYRMMHNFTFF